MTHLPAPSKIKTHRIYTVWEAADTLGKHRQIILRWIKNKGLIADTRLRPWLIKGSDLKVWLGQRRQKNRCKLALHHLYCPGCKSPQEPDGKIADYVPLTPSTGMLSALCPTCECVTNKVIRRTDLDAIRAKIEVTIQQVEPRIVSRTDAPLNVTLSNEDQTHVKAHD